MTESEHLAHSAKQALQQLTKRGIIGWKYTPSAEPPNELEVWAMARDVYNRVKKTTETEVVYVLVTMAWPEDCMARGCTISFDIEFMADGDVFIPAEESKFGVAFIIQTWNSFPIHFEGLAGRMFTLHNDHYNAAVIEMAKHAGVELCEVVSEDMLFEEVESRYQKYTFFVPCRRTIVRSDMFQGNTRLYFVGVRDPDGWDPSAYRKGVKQHYFWLSKYSRQNNNQQTDNTRRAK